MGKKESFYVDVMAMHPEVTGSCNLVIVKLPDGRTIRFVVDCGLFQEKPYSQLNETLPFNPEHIDFCVVTHNHVDHTGRLPFMVKKGFCHEIYTTDITKKLLPLALKDSYGVIKDSSKNNHTKCLYEERHVHRAVELVSPCEFNKAVSVGENVKLTFLRNGHLVGAAIVLVQISYPSHDTINLLFTGDYNNKNMFFDVNPIPERILNLPLTVIQESTYGDMESSDIHKCFEENISKGIYEGKSVIVPVFSLGRSQEILYVLKCMQDKGTLDVNIPVYLDGTLARKYTEKYLEDGLDIKEEMRAFLPRNFAFVDKIQRGRVLSGTEAKIVLTTSGMGSYGPAQLYIPEYIVRKNALIHFTGYTAEGTLGNKLQQAEHGGTVKIGGHDIKKWAQVEYTTEFSAHAKADEMIDFLKQFKNLKLVLVNHGRIEAKNSFAKRIVDEINPKDVGVLGKDRFYRVCPFGLVRSIASKFE